MKRIVVGALGLGVAGALAASGAAVAHFVTVAAQSPAHTSSKSQGKGSATITHVEGNGSGTSGSDSKGDTNTSTGSNHLRVSLKDAQGDRIGQVDIAPLDHGGNLVTISVSNLKPGFHAIQLHSVGVCDPNSGSAFASAGGLLQPAGTGNPAAGAFPVLAVGSNGKAQARFLDSNFKLRDLSGPSGSSIVVFSVFPSGTDAAQAAAHRATNSQSRIACGVVVRSRITTGMTPTPSPMPTSGGVVPPINGGGQSTAPAPGPTTLQGHHW